MSDIVERLRALVILDEVGSDNPLGRDAADRIQELEMTLHEARIHFEEITDGARVDDDFLERIEIVLGMPIVQTTPPSKD
jgi:hypothetical protein